LVLIEIFCRDFLLNNKGNVKLSKYEIKEFRIIGNATHINLCYIFKLIQML
jgi:hypothetical protein